MSGLGVCKEILQSPCENVKLSGLPCLTRRLNSVIPWQFENETLRARTQIPCHPQVLLSAFKSGSGLNSHQCYDPIFCPYNIPETYHKIILVTISGL